MTMTTAKAPANTPTDDTTTPDDNTVVGKPANDNSELVVVWDQGGKRNYVMRRFHTGYDLDGSPMTGEVDLGKKVGLWIGYALLDEKTRKYVFTRVREIARTMTTTGDKDNSTTTA